MGTKNNPAPYDCYANALPDEPMFILLARDPIAPRIVREWADGLEAAIKGGHKPESDRAKVEEAWQCSHAMQDWRRDHYGEWHDPQLPVATLPAVRRAVQAALDAGLCPGDAGELGAWLRRAELTGNVT